MPTRTARPSFPLPPRDVFRRRGLSVPTRLLLFCLVPHVWVGVGFLAATVWIPCVQWFGQDVTATVVGKEVHRGKGNHYRYELRYAYDVGGRGFNGSVDVTERAFNARYAIGSPLPVRALGVLGRSSSRALTPDGIGAGFLQKAGFALFWNGILSVFVLSICAAPLRERRLIRDGEVAPGRITDKQEVKGKSVERFVLYTFRSGDGREQTGKMLVKKEEYEFVKAGDDVTVVFDPARPSRSVVYKYCQYAARDAYGYEITAA